MVAIYIGVILMIYGCFTATLCITADYTGILYYISWVTIPLGVGFFGFGMTYVNNEISNLKNKINDMQIEMSAVKLWMRKKKYEGDGRR